LIKQREPLMNRLLILVAAFIVAFASSQKAGAVESARELANKCQKIGKNYSGKWRHVYIQTHGLHFSAGGAAVHASDTVLVLIDQDGNRIFWSVCSRRDHLAGPYPFIPGIYAEVSW
jgi:hypothetical protein